MANYKVTVNNLINADAILKGKKTFDMLEGLLGLQVGDTIEYVCRDGSGRQKHDIDGKLYEVTWIDIIYGHGRAVSIKPINSNNSNVESAINKMSGE